MISIYRSLFRHGSGASSSIINTGLTLTTSTNTIYNGNGLSITSTSLLNIDTGGIQHISSYTSSIPISITKRTIPRKAFEKIKLVRHDRKSKESIVRRERKDKYNNNINNNNNSKVRIVNGEEKGAILSRSKPTTKKEDEIEDEEEEDAEVEEGNEEEIEDNDKDIEVRKSRKEIDTESLSSDNKVPIYTFHPNTYNEVLQQYIENKQYDHVTELLKEMKLADVKITENSTKLVSTIFKTMPASWWVGIDLLYEYDISPDLLDHVCMEILNSSLSPYKDLSKFLFRIRYKYEISSSTSIINTLSNILSMKEDDDEKIEKHISCWTRVISKFITPSMFQRIILIELKMKSKHFTPLMCFELAFNNNKQHILRVELLQAFRRYVRIGLATPKMASLILELVKSIMVDKVKAGEVDLPTKRIFVAAFTSLIMFYEKKGLYDLQPTDIKNKWDEEVVEMESITKGLSQEWKQLFEARYNRLMPNDKIKVKRWLDMADEYTNSIDHYIQSNSKK